MQAGYHNARLSEPGTSNPRECPVCGARLQSAVIHGEDRFFGTEGAFSIASCPRCGLGVTIPRLDGDRLAARYPQQYGPYRPPAGRLARLLARLRVRRADAVLRSAPFAELVTGKRGRLLDVGCGRGDLASAFVRSGWTADGIEPSEQAVDAARRQGVDARVGTLDDIPDEFAGYDLVVFNHALEHVADPVADLTRVAERLAPGGAVVASVPDFDSWQRRRFGSNWFHLDLPRHLQHFTERALEEAFARAGMQRVALVPAVSLVGFWASVQYAIFGRCVFRGPAHRVGLALAGALYPVSLLVGRLRGADTMSMVARRREAT